MLVKHHMAKEVTQMKTCYKDCIHFKLKRSPNLTFVACYLAPNDSPFYSDDSIAGIQELVKDNPSEQVILIGDMNARFASTRELFTKNMENATYCASKDKLQTPNSNARLLTHTLVSLVLVNNLQYKQRVFGGDLTIQQGNRWVSELNVCLVSPSLLDSLLSFNVHHDKLPSNHAPISVTLQLASNMDTNGLLGRASNLGSYLPTKPKEKSLCKRQIRMRTADQAAARLLLSEVQPPDMCKT